MCQLRLLPGNGIGYVLARSVLRWRGDLHEKRPTTIRYWFVNQQYLTGRGGAMAVKSNRTYKVLGWVTIFMGLLALTLACASPSAAEAQATLCSNLTTFQMSVEELTNLDRYSTTGEVKAAADMVRHSFEAVQQANAEVNNAQVEALENAYQDLRGAIDDLPDETPIPEAVRSLQPQIAAVRSARQEVTSGVECP
jgi:hypothetical protein